MSVYGAFMESNPLLVSAGDLDSWADTEDAKGAFPELMRRLLAQTPGVSNINIRAHEGTAAPGWDGTATSAGSAYLPAGELRFEFGTNQDPKRKANEDYKKRAKEAAGTTDEIYLFATPRNWAKAAAWAEKRRNEKVFASVEAFDAHRLEGWLQSIPAVHHWISERLGKPASGAQTLTAWWERLRRNCTIEVPPDFHTAGRQKEADKLLDLLATSDKVTSIQSSWRDDAIAFCHSVLFNKDTDALVRTMVVSDAQAWHELAIQPSKIILIPTFDNPDIGLAMGNGHGVIRPVIEMDSSRDDSDVVTLLKVDRWAGATALARAGLDFLKADKLTALARRSMCRFYRQISFDKARSRPDWAKDKETVDVLAPLVLVGAWEVGHPGDLDLISRFVDLDGNEISSRLDELVDRYPLDPPFIRSGRQWRLVDAMDAAVLLLPRLSSAHIERWENLVNDVLLATRPLEGKSATEAPNALINGLRPPFSSTLTHHVARGIALAAAASNRRTGSLANVGRCVDHIVKGLIDKGCENNGGSGFGRLSQNLPFLAEASPGKFLEAIELWLEQQDAGALSDVTQADSDPKRLLSAAPFIKRALQCLTWSPEYFGRAARALVRLGDLAVVEADRHDYVEAVTIAVAGWSSFGAGGWQEKIDIVTWMLEKCSSFGWPLVEGLVIQTIGFAHPPKPLFRDWDAEKESLVAIAPAAYRQVVLGAAVRLAGFDAERWLYLLRAIGRLPIRDRREVIDVFRGIAAQAKWNSDQSLEIWSFLRTMVSLRQASSDAQSAWIDEELRILVDLLDVLEPAEDPRKFAWLFDYDRCIIIDGLTSKDEDFSEILQERRDNALTSVIQGGDVQIRALVEASKNVNCIGEFLARTDSELEPCILSWLDGESPTLHKAASVYVWSRAKQGGMPWVRSILEQGSLSADGERRFVASLPQNTDMWSVIADTDERRFRAYWENVSVFQIEEKGRCKVLDVLLEYGCAAKAIDLLSIMIGVEQWPKASQTVRALSLLCESMESEGGTALRDDVEELIAWLESEAGDHPDLPMLEFRLLTYGYDRTFPDSLYRMMACQPGFFVDCVKTLHGSGESQATHASQVYRHGCWKILYYWRRLPGLSDNGTIDGEHLARWVEEARKLLNADGLGGIADTQVGKVLASSPDGRDGMWPAEEVRDLLEDAKSRDLEQGIAVGRYNRRGVASRGILDGGAREWCLALRYREHSRKMSVRWPRTAAVLDGLAEEYELEAKREDEKAEERADQD